MMPVTSDSPVGQLRELLRKLAMLSVPVALIEIALAPPRTTGAVLVGAAALVLLAGLWALRPSAITWTPTEQLLEGVLLGTAGATCGSPTLVLAVFYGGVYYRALADGRHAPVRAVLTYQGIIWSPSSRLILIWMRRSPGSCSPPSPASASARC